METDQHINQIVNNIIGDLTSKIQSQVKDAIAEQISSAIEQVNYQELISQKIDQIVSYKLNQYPINTLSLEENFKNKLDQLATGLYATMTDQAVSVTKASVASYIDKIDLMEVCQNTLLKAMQDGTFAYPPNSISGTALNKETLTISGDNIVGGIIQNFGSTGIDDRATSCQLTVLDDVTVVENNLLTKDLTVKGTVSVEGDLTVSGTVNQDSPFFQNLVEQTTQKVKNSYDEQVYESYSNLVYNELKTNGLDLNKVTLNGEAILSNGALSARITDSNLQKLGTLKELQVSGETLLTQTLYVTNKRAGINTIEPAQAFTVWDEEIEIGLGKKINNTGIFGTPRAQALVLSSNNKNNLILETDGSVTASTINIGNTVIKSSPVPPNDDQPRGTVVFNSNPNLGGPLGWVSLGNANWANFGIID